MLKYVIHDLHLLTNVNPSVLSPLQQLRQNTRNRIIEYLSGIDRIQGVYPHQLAESLGITRQYVHELLKELMNEKRIIKRGRKYVAADPDLGIIIVFARLMKMVSGLLIAKNIIEPSSDSEREYFDRKLPPRDKNDISTFNEDFYQEFCEIVSGITVSRTLLEPKFTKETLNEKYLFEFANRIGAFITYIFIESVRPYEYNIRGKDERWKRQKRNILGYNLIGKAIDIKWLFEVFQWLLYSTGQLSHAEHSRSTSPLFFEARKNEFNDLMKTFSKVYPGIYEGLEKYWQEEMYFPTRMLNAVERFAPEILEDCNHKWQKMNIYKIEGNFYFCLSKCHILIDERQKRYLDEKEGEMKKASR